jgi:hypothetical protein
MKLDKETEELLMELLEKLSEKYFVFLYVEELEPKSADRVLKIMKCISEELPYQKCKNCGKLIPSYVWALYSRNCENCVEKLQKREEMIK